LRRFDSRRLHCEWHPGCPVPVSGLRLSGLRLLTVTSLRLRGRAPCGTLVVDAEAAGRLATVVRRLARSASPIHHLRLADEYGPRGRRPADGEVTASTEAAKAVPSRCAGGAATGSSSEHAYGEAVDVGPAEGPNVGCGRTRDRGARPSPGRPRRRTGMV